MLMLRNLRRLFKSETRVDRENEEGKLGCSLSCQKFMTKQHSRTLIQRSACFLCWQLTQQISLRDDIISPSDSSSRTASKMSFLPSYQHINLVPSCVYVIVKKLTFKIVARIFYGSRSWSDILYKSDWSRWIGRVYKIVGFLLRYFGSAVYGGQKTEIKFRITSFSF